MLVMLQYSSAIKRHRLRAKKCPSVKYFFHIHTPTSISKKSRFMIGPCLAFLSLEIEEGIWAWVHWKHRYCIRQEYAKVRENVEYVYNLRIICRSDSLSPARSKESKILKPHKAESADNDSLPYSFIYPSHSFCPPLSMINDQAGKRCEVRVYLGSDMTKLGKDTTCIPNSIKVLQNCKSKI